MSEQQNTGLIAGPDGSLRCAWPGSDELYRRYHDNEWGRPVSDDIRLFEKICLEGFQSGLSWLTILRKRENFRAAFDGFDFDRVAKGRILPVMMEGGPANPLGARAMYLGDTLYRIHGTNAPWTIGTNVSSGCIRLRNEDVVDLFERVKVGTKVIVM
jgi:hypothetical protein